VADPLHLRELLQGARRWNHWRRTNPGVIPNLCDVDLSSLCLSLTEPDVDPTDWDTTRKYLAPGIDLSRADLRGANLAHSQLFAADFRSADLQTTDLRGATLWQANFDYADLSRALISEASLRKASIQQADLYQTEMWGCEFDETRFLDIDLSTVEGLESASHSGPSFIGVDTLYRSGGQIPHKFLRGCGLPGSFVEYMPSLITPASAVQFYSCFISYSTKDQVFASTLRVDLSLSRIRCWLASEDMKIGDPIRTRIDDAIRVHDKLLLVLSAASLGSQWVEQEVETALAKERAQNRLVLFPVRLDDTVFAAHSGWPAYLRNTRHIGDFSQWTDRHSYRGALSRLMRDLKTPAEPKTA